MSRRLFPIVVLLGVLVALGGLAIIERSAGPANANDIPLLSADAAATTTTTTTTEPPTTTTAAPPAAAPPKAASSGRPPRPSAPVGVPRNPRAAEPIVEIGTIEIPKIGLNHRIYHGITMRNIDLGPSHWPGTAFPGENGNAVFAGHRVTKTRPFRDIDRLVEGDEVFFVIDGKRTRYLVTGHEVVTPDALRIVAQTPTPTATLFACHPPGSAKYRYVVKLALAAE